MQRDKTKHPDHTPEEKQERDAHTPGSWEAYYLGWRQRDKPSPESQETVDDCFSTDGMDAKGIAEKIDEVMAELRKAAGDLVRSWFMKRGYFNGRAESFVNHVEDSIQCKIVVSSYGRPDR